MNNQNGQLSAYDKINRGHQDGLLHQEIANTVAAHQNDPTPESRRNIETLIASLESAQRAPWLPTTEDLSQLSNEMILLELKKILSPTKLTVHTKWDFPIPDREWLIPDWLPAGRIGMFTGKSEKGKSLLALQLAVSIATGGGQWESRGGNGATKWTGPGTASVFAKVESGTVIMAGWEDEHEEVRRRIGWIEKSERNASETRPLPDRMGDRFGYTDLARCGPVWGREEIYPHAASKLTLVGQDLRRRCEEHNACLLILDPLINAFGASENANEDAAQFMADWGGWGRDTGCAVLIVHHPAKSGTSQGSKDEDDKGYRGAGAWKNESRFYWQLTESEVDNQTRDVLIRHKGSYVPPDKPKQIYLTNDRDTGWIWATANTQTAQTHENVSSPRKAATNAV